MLTAFTSISYRYGALAKNMVKLVFQKVTHPIVKSKMKWKAQQLQPIILKEKLHELIVTPK